MTAAIAAVILIGTACVAGLALLAYLPRRDRHLSWRPGRTPGAGPDSRGHRVRSQCSSALRLPQPGVALYEAAVASRTPGVASRWLGSYLDSAQFAAREEDDARET